MRSTEENAALDRQRVFTLITDLQAAANYYYFYKAVHTRAGPRAPRILKIVHGSRRIICYARDPMQVNIANIFVNLGRVFKFFAAQPR